MKQFYICVLFVLLSAYNTFAQSPTAPALDFNVFLQKGATLITNETEGPIALGGNLTLAGNYQVAIHSAGTYKVNNLAIGLLIGGKVIYQSGNNTYVNNGYVKIGDATGSTVWYKDNNGAYSNIQITSGAYNANPQISIQNNAQNLGVSATSNPVIQSGLIDFAAAFTTLKANSASIATLSNNASLTNPNGGAISNTGLPNQVKINLNSGTNVLNISGTDLNNVSVFTFNNAPDVNHVLVINVNAPGSFTWNVWNQAGVGFSNCPYIIYNFYNATTLNIGGNNTIEGTVFAPYADITKTVNQSNIEGQIIAQSYYQSGGENHYTNFTPTVGGGCSNPVVADITGAASVCSGSTTTLNDVTANGTWSSSNTSIATVSSSGVITGVAAGTATITYSVTNTCGTTSKTASVTVKEATTSTTNINVCSTVLPYIWNGNSYNVAGTYTVHLTNAAGCDSAATLILSVKQATTSTTNTSVCSTALPYLWNGNSYNAAGTYLVHLTNAAGCDSAATLILSVKQATISTTNTSVCSTALPYLWNGNSYNAAGTYTIHLTNAAGCDSTATLVLTVKIATSSTTTTTIVNAQLPYTWNGNLYNAAGTYTVHLTNADGCDSAATLHLNVQYPSASITNVSVCSTSLPYLWNSNSYNAAGTYLVHLINARGFDSTATLVLTVKQTSTSTTNANVCSTALPYLWNANSYTTTGTYIIHLTNAAGCDSTATLILSVKQASVSTTNASVCSTSLPYVWNGNPYNSSGTYIAHLTNAAGCDSTATLILNVKQANTSTTAKTIIGSQLPYIWNGNSYNTAGTYTVHLTNAAGCDSAATLILTVQYPTASTTNINVCSTALPYIWNGGSFNAAGTYTIHLTNAAGYDSAATLIFNVQQASASTTAKNVCSTALPYTWNGNSYNTSGSYTVHLTNAAGCDSAATLILTVTAVPAINSSVSNISCNGSSNGSILLNITGGNAPYSYLWNDGNLQQNRSGLSAGNYSVSVTDANGCTASGTNSFAVTQPDAIHINGVVSNVSVAGGNDGSINVTSTGGTGAYGYLWSDGNSNKDRSALRAGAYSVTVTDAYLCTALQSFIVTAPAGNPTNMKVSAKVDTAVLCISNNSFKFTNTSTSTCGCLTYVWNFGDGTTSTDVNPFKTYNTPGDYTVTLVATDDTNHKDSFNIYVQVVSTPTIEFTIDPTTEQCFKGNKFTFTNSTHGNFSGLKYLWDFGNGLTSTETNPSISYQSSGDYTVTLTGNFKNLCPASLTKVLHVYPTPTADYTYQVDNATRKVTFADASTIASGTVNYTWTFGDNNSDGGASTQNIYAKDGLYNVALIARSNEHACADTIVKSILVGNPTVCATGFMVDKNSQCKNENEFHFVNTTHCSLGGGNATYTWTFGDGTGSSDANPIKTYTVAGTYTVKLISTMNGVKDSSTAVVTVLPSPVVKFVVNEGTEYCLKSANNNFSFTNQSTAPAGISVNYQWTLGTGRILNSIDATDQYNGAGNYTIALTGTGDNGCSATSTQIVHVYATPNTKFAYFQDSLNYAKVHFDNTTNVADASTVYYTWHFGDGDSLADHDADHIYAADGKYSVILSAVSEHGCAATSTKVVTVKDSLIAAIGIDKTCLCLDGNEFDFVAKTWGTKGTVTYLWSFSDGTTSTQTNPKKNFAAAGDYNVVLTATSSNGSVAKASQLIRINPKPTAAFTYFNAGGSVNFSNTSVAGASDSLHYIWDFGDGTVSTETNPTKVYNVLGSYKVKLSAISTGGCKDTLAQTVAINIAQNGASQAVQYLQVSVTPNPAVSIAQVSFKTINATEKCTIKVLNSFGLAITQQTISNVPGGTSINVPVNLGSLPTGYYYAVISDGNNTLLGSCSFLKN